ncbi:PepSY-associated TM helix domain-containing protein [Parasphingorhabdus sp.]|uniref:PepSY-associated TM helix domain-containing protein n=1 Tax=Parasphingorhabdus sp. TaxID=2709688 RepID=UPI003265F756
MKDIGERKKPVKSKRKKQYELHTWVGFHLAFIMSLVLFTGTVATLSNEIDWMINDDMRVTPGTEMVSWGAMEKAVREHSPDGNIASIYTMGPGYFAYRASVFDEFNKLTYVHVNQWTGEITGETHPLTVQRFFRDLHRYLFMPNYLGLPVVGSLSFILLISLYTGLKTTRNWRTVMMRVRRDRGVRIMVGDLHKAAGIWGSWFFIVMAVTGLWYLTEFGYAVAGERMEAERPDVTEQRTARRGMVLQDRPLQEVVTVAKKALPELQITGVQYPLRSNQVFTVLGVRDNPLLRDRANRVFIDPIDLSVIKAQPEENISTVAYLNEMADPLHFGTFGGLTTKIIWFIFGISMTGLSITGIWLTWRRLKSKAVTKAQFATLPILLLSLLFFSQWMDRYREADLPDVEKKFVQKRTASGLQVSLAIGQDPRAEAGPARLVLQTEGRPNLRAVSLCNREDCQETKLPVQGRSMSIPVDLPDSSFSTGDIITAKLSYNNDQEEQVEWRWR